MARTGMSLVAGVAIVSVLLAGLGASVIVLTSRDPLHAKSMRIDGVCARALPDGRVRHVLPTTVGSVRMQVNGHPGMPRGAPGLWLDLPSKQFAAWCVVETVDGFEVGAATSGVPFAFFGLSERYPGAHPFPIAPAVQL